MKKLTLVTDGAHVEQFWDSELGRELQHLRARTQVLTEEKHRQETDNYREQMERQLAAIELSKNNLITKLTDICEEITEYQDEANNIKEEIDLLEGDE